jgi:hypothetical protein
VSAGDAAMSVATARAGAASHIIAALLM